MRLIYLFLFGYVRATVNGEGLSSVASAILKLGISARIKKNSFVLSLREAKIISKSVVAPFLTISSVRGVLPYILSFKKRYFTAVALLLVITLNILLSGLVFDIRVSGNKTVPSYKIKSSLEAAGLSVGRRFSSIDTEEVEINLLSSLESIAWVNINRRGTVAYVEVVEKKGGEVGKPQKSVPSNIVAACDCVIEEITVHSGKAEVQVGDVVRRGDVLISGVVENGAGTSFVRAEGRVIGSVFGTVTVNVTRKERIIVGYSTKTVGFSFNILNFSANIFKNYSNSYSACDIIVDNEYLCLKSGKRMPIGYTRKIALVPILEDKVYSDGEMIEIAYRRHANMLESFLLSREALKITTEGKMAEDSFEVKSTVLYLTDIGEEKNIEVKN